MRTADASQPSDSSVTYQDHSDSELLILVDNADREVGFLGKGACHDGHGVLHRAFSLLIFNRDGQLLLQQRAASKRLWPLYWSNSCCSHPRRDESLEAATHRRLREELGMSCKLKFLFKFQYHAQFDDAAGERELCSVYIGRSDQPVERDPREVHAFRWISPKDLASELSEFGQERFTPWFRLEWDRVWREHRAELQAL
jgi:isopentenyl-diphosphate Delta-isomerase